MYINRSFSQIINRYLIMYDNEIMIERSRRRSIWFQRKIVGNRHHLEFQKFPPAVVSDAIDASLILEQ